MVVSASLDILITTQEDYFAYIHPALDPITAGSAVLPSLPRSPAADHPML